MDIAAWLRSLGLEMRMARLDTGMAWAEDAPLRTPAQKRAGERCDWRP